uniref:Uncharacterized protein n=1 Tax=Hyaloperonospora arabidopsidis (strain Emoy2) TaxID=559515 RepID=M4B4C5_HYAAE
MEDVAKCSRSSLPAPVEASVVSDTTTSSSDRSRSSSCSSSGSSANALDDDYGAHALSLLSSSEEDEEDEEEDKEKDVDRSDGEQMGASVSAFLVKPMTSRLQVCPVDDLAMEDEKRRRRSRRHRKSGQTHKSKNVLLLCGMSRDTESLPSTPSPILVRTRRSDSSPALLAPPAMATTNTSSESTRDNGHESTEASAPSSAAEDLSAASETAVRVPAVLLRRDSAAIRRQYWSQLGFSLSRSDLEKSTGRKKERRDGLKVRLNDVKCTSEQGAKGGFFQFIASWYAPVTAVTGDDPSVWKDKSRAQSTRQLRSSLSRHSMSSNGDLNDVVTRKKGVQFNQEAELFYIPLHRDYSKRQRECMWPTRAEFIAMVERNLDAVYDEIEREYETQLENELLENEGMAREEARQRTIESQQRKLEEAAATESQGSVPPGARSRSSSSTSSLMVPMLTLSQKHVLVSPRARSSHDLRFKYLKHLGIHS